MAQNDEEKAPKKVTDIEAAKDNIEKAVYAFNERWASMPGFALGVEVMDHYLRRLSEGKDITHVGACSVSLVGKIQSAGWGKLT